MDSIAEIDLNPYVLTEYEVEDYVLRRYPRDKNRIFQPKQVWYLAWTIPGDGGNKGAHGVRLRKVMVHHTEHRLDKGIL